MKSTLTVISVAACLALTPPTIADQASVPDVPQPAGWDADLKLPEAVDTNPDPRVLETSLEAKVVTLELQPGKKTTVWTYNGLLPGPMIRARVGDTVIVHFKNSLPEPTTIHWHGLRVPNEMDGSPDMPRPPVAPGGEFRYEFVLRDAGTYWYHPHVRSSAQVGAGLYGALLVTDPADSAAFGDDLVLVLSDISVDESGTLLPADNGGPFGDLFGREGALILVNGKVRPRVKVRVGKPQRWRVINASRARYFHLAPPTGQPFTWIGGDNGLAARSERLARVTVTPGERADLVFTSRQQPGTSAPLRWLPFDRGYGSTFGREPEPILTIETVDEPAVTSAAVPVVLREIPAIDIRNAVTHTLDLTIASLGSTVEMGIGGVPFSKAKPLHARVGETHVWTITNETAFDHPFHLHGFFFQVLDDDRVPEWKDTVNIPVKSSVRLAIRFDERPGMWMYHCHILDHAEAGMMGHLHLE